MAPSTIPKLAMSQEKMFYNSGWTRDVERAFISFLLSERASGIWVVGERNDIAIRNATNYLNQSFPMKFDFKTVKEQCRKLKSRYNAFKWLIQRPLVIYDPISHKVLAADATWNWLYNEKILVGPYVYEGEHAFDAMRELFEHPVVPGNANEGHAIIQISSDTEDVSGNDSSVREIPNPYGQPLPSINESDRSSVDTDNIFYPEYAFVGDDSVTWRSYCTGEMSGVTSTNSPEPRGRGQNMQNVSTPGRYGGPSGSSSCASWSPLKKN